MRSEPRLIGIRDISEYKLVETGVSSYASVDGVNRHEDDPRDKPDGKKDADDHAEKSNKEVRVESVGVCNELVIGSYYG